ncbi:ribulose-phosphate 3-epimerase [Bradymonas sediminis]|uniref:Ribulose-phosphate 3-epimerase n=1 Tax=Bradymonas sediminis TaxID=1548548 RepID=A0A2Z4FJW9_9DELT|nr:ribulose-phosphate 3-epimerase [Bradymonas sediminis]AWV89277.1 ribulose-phosphate 3-epimerase [Bradymonas sediminis]TDP73449.1 ribulose-5-phosphate 3-epimerase [Bradymonas sediminis]
MTHRHKRRPNALPAHQPLLAPSILSANFTRLAEECQAVIDGGADLLHIDVMDGHFVENITIGLPVVEALRAEFPDTFLDVHIMISNPDLYAAKFVEAGADSVSFHPEATVHSHGVIQEIHAAGGLASLAINPSTSLDVLDYIIEDLDMILIMGVNPGFGGQSFIPQTMRKLKDVKERLARHGIDDMPIQVDGGVKLNNIAEIYQAGANVLVSGSGVFNNKPYKDTISAMKAELQPL